MSSRDRNRSNRQRQPEPDPGSYYSDDVIYDDDVLYEEDWNEFADYDDQPEVAPPAQSRASRKSAPSFQGTAAQIDRLRRNIGRSSGTDTDRQQSPATSRPAPATRRTQRQAPQIQSPPISEDDAYFDDGYEDPQAPTAPSAPRQTRLNPVRSRTARPTAAAPEPTGYYDDQYDDQGYDVYEDEYSDDFSEYDAPVRPRRPARPRPQINMPALSRPSLPPAIANADLVNDAPALGIIGVGLASLAGMAIFVANQADSLAPSFATHVSASGILENFKDESALWHLPIMATAFTLMNIAIAWFVSPMDRFASRFALAAALVVQVVVWVAIFRII